MSWCRGRSRGVRTSRRETRRAASGHFVTPGTVTALLSAVSDLLGRGVTPCPATVGSPSVPAVLSLLAFPPLALSVSPFPGAELLSRPSGPLCLRSAGPTRRFPAALRGDAARPRTCPFRARCPSSSRIFCLMWSPLGRSLVSPDPGTVLVGAKRVQGRQP